MGRGARRPVAHIDIAAAARYLSRMDKPMTGGERAAQYRARLKDRGLRRVQMVIPDLWTPATQARLQAACTKLAAESTTEQQALIAFSDAAWRDMPE